MEWTSGNDDAARSFALGFLGALVSLDGLPACDSTSPCPVHFASASWRCGLATRVAFRRSP